MSKKTVGILGILLLICSIWLTNILKTFEKNATSLDKQKTDFGIIMGPPSCSWEISTPERIMSENKTQAIVINTSNTKSENCESRLYLRAPNFDISPSKDEQKVSLNAGTKGSVSWVITPRKIGSYEIAITDNIDTKVFGVVVNNMLGLNGWQAKILSSLGTLFGPMLTIPWWWDRIKKDKTKT